MKAVINMLVKKINPQGYCKGVIMALKKCLEVINDPNTIKPIYLLGMIIHNRFVCDELKKMGVIILEGNDKLSILDKIDSGTVIISAHGVSSKVKEKVISKKINLVDATCPDVELVHNNVKKYIGDGYEVIYVGKKNHPEAIGVIEESNLIHLVEDLSDLDTLPNKKYYVTNQTTLAHSHLEKFHNKISELFMESIIENNICNATTKREKALYDLESDLIIVVGDYQSSNTKKLFETAKNKARTKEVIAIERACDLLNYNLNDYKTAYITSGASTPSIIVDQVIRFLESDCKDLAILNEKLFLL